MAINKNHLFEDLDGVKCAVVEAGVHEARKDFLKALLESNGYTVVVVPEPAKAVQTAEGTEPPPTQPATFKLGVTDVTFNATNAIFGRLLKTPHGKVVTLAYWQQKEAESREDVPYYQSQPYKT